MEIKRVQAPLTNIRPEMVKPKPSAQTPAQTPQKNLQPAAKPVNSIKIHAHAKVEICEKHKMYKVAYEHVSG